MVKTLVKHGNSYALIIDKPIMDLLKITPETPLEITTDGNALVMSPEADPKRREKFEKALAEGNKRYGRMLKRLA
ncbi:MAG: AbrB/MazE/SpoVT family DNA-binding domain-containing protein [Planctomycetes bacterium]|nr:AbrB/MazE/SpoVT family DNA-binding domain-containing protein [Planctomycetota bacterium]